MWLSGILLLAYLLQHNTLSNGREIYQYCVCKLILPFFVTARSIPVALDESIAHIRPQIDIAVETNLDVPTTPFDSEKHAAYQAVRVRDQRVTSSSVNLRNEDDGSVHHVPGREKRQISNCTAKLILACFVLWLTSL